MSTKPDYPKYFILKPKCKSDIKSWRCYSRWMQLKFRQWLNIQRADKTLSALGLSINDLNVNVIHMVIP